MSASDEPLPEITVVAGIIRDGEGRLCLSRRPEHKHQGGLWEFPGGKVEPGEALDVALARELHEELGLDVTGCEPFMTVRHRYPDLKVTLHFREVSRYGGEPHGREGQPVEWVPLADVTERAFPAANRPVALALRLPQEWVVVPEGLDEQAVITGLERLDPQRQGVYLRNWSQGPSLSRLAAVCRERGLRFWIRDDMALAVREEASGLHLSRRALMAASAAELGGFAGVVSAACHDSRALERALALDIPMAVVSPVAATATHPDVVPLGWDGFAALTEVRPLVFYALGGLSPDDLTTAREHGAYGVAGIRAFWPGVD
ncbi:hypothetical protein A6D6_00350 [Alcanivorax xiamenensis]|uniref:8-oxo-dGTP diphosphatase n=1 Tax=Alcanivorax xiamenensis TaxID=1177156 RepID=A0ABQ6YD88_9GAMM|nr:Nudix family hydrolase [Alcanivorax xiamenensis]KAF0807960.1 hypothetical protein A6D6_00350 [Alcanivorax xiamenensis]